MWPEDLEPDHEYRLAAGLLGARSRRQLDALEALMGRPLTHAELAKRIQGSGSRAVVTNTVKSLRSKGLVQTGLLSDLKTPSTSSRVSGPGPFSSHTSNCPTA